MDNYRLIKVEWQGAVACIRLRKSRLDESEIQQLGEEVIDAAGREGNKAALSLGPQTPECLYSVFLAKLIAVRNALKRKGGDFALVEVGPVAYSVFEACLLHREFTFLPDFAAALAHFGVTA